MFYLSKYPGIIVDNNDPQKLGRCKVRIPEIYGVDGDFNTSMLPWARIINSTTTGVNRGLFILPKIGDTVWVSFLSGDKAYPIILGSSFSKVTDASNLGSAIDKVNKILAIHGMSDEYFKNNPIGESKKSKKALSEARIAKALRNALRKTLG